MAASAVGKYPPGAMVTKLFCTYEIKQSWLYHEWAPECQFHKAIQPYFPDREALNPSQPNPNTLLVLTIFNRVRGQYGLWQDPRELGRWKRVDVEHLSADWVRQNVALLYSCKERFPVPSLSGVVLWRSRPGANKKYELHEGNHRISTWLAEESPTSIKATLYIGKPKRDPPPFSPTTRV